MQANRRPHPTLSDVALALAQRRSDPITKVTLSLNAKGDVQIEVDVNDTDPQRAKDQAQAIFGALRDEYPRDNGVEQYQAEVRRLKDARKGTEK